MKLYVLDGGSLYLDESQCLFPWEPRGARACEGDEAVMYFGHTMRLFLGSAHGGPALE